ncbi:MAG: DNA-binding protein [Cyanobacteriota bacterium]
METKTAPYDVAEFLDTPEKMVAYLEACIQESDGDAAFIAKALGDIARAKWMTQIARKLTIYFWLSSRIRSQSVRRSARRSATSSTRLAVT